VYFIPRNNRVYAFLIARSRFEWGAITLGACFAATLLWWYMWYIPLQYRILQAERDYTNLCKQQDVLARTAHEINELDTHIATLRTELRQTLGNSSVGYKRLLNALIINVVESGLALNNCSLKIPETKEWCRIHPVELQVAGSFKQLVVLLQALSNQEGAIFLKQLSIDRTEDGKVVSTLLFSLIEIIEAIHGV
jgi:Tfp pilus assembly protein PilO